MPVRSVSTWLGRSTSRLRTLVGRHRRGAVPTVLELERKQLLSTWAYDFGTLTSPVKPGYTQVTQKTRYSSTKGYGLTSTNPQSRDRLVGDKLTRDFVFADGYSLVFAKALPDGVYDVAITAGDASYKHSQSVWIEGQWTDLLNISKNQFVQRTYRATVTDGRLEVMMRGANGDRTAILNAMTITLADAPPPPPPPPEVDGSIAQFDFGTPTSPVAAGFTQVVGATSYNSVRGYGWTTPAQSQTRAGGDALNRDFGLSVGTGVLGFAVDLPDGTYDVTLVMGDGSYARSQSVWIEDQLQETVAIPKGQVWDRQYRVEVADGRLDILLKKAGSSLSALLNGMVVTPVEPGDTSLLAEDFEDVYLGSRGWYDGQVFALGDDATTGSHSLQYSFLTGADTPYDSRAVRHMFPATESIYLSFDLKLSDNWTWGEIGPHLFYFLTNADEAYKGPAATHLTLYTEPPSGYMQVAAQDNLNATMPHGMTQQVGPSTNYRKFRSAEPVIMPGQWAHIEAYFQLNSLDLAHDRPNPDGVARAWVNGQMLVETTDWIFRTTDFPQMKINQLLIGPYFHGGVPHNQALWIDNLTLATAPPATSNGGGSAAAAGLTAATVPAVPDDAEPSPPLVVAGNPIGPVATNPEAAAQAPAARPSAPSVPDPQPLARVLWGLRVGDTGEKPTGPTRRSM